MSAKEGASTQPMPNWTSAQTAASRAQALMRGDDEIAITLREQPAIEAHYAAVKAGSDWLFPQTLERSGNP